MDNGDWLQRVMVILAKCEENDKIELLLHCATIATNLGYLIKVGED